LLQLDSSWTWMLAPQRMSSHGGDGSHQSFPFGCKSCPLKVNLNFTDMTSYTDNQNVIHNIGLPDFITPGPPIGQPLLNEDENANFNNFLSGFDSNPMQDKHGQQHQYHMDHGQGDMWNMPPTFVGSETTMGPLAGIDPAQLERHALMYGEGLGTRVPGVHVGPASHIPYGNGNQGLQDNWSQSLFHQLHSAASGVQPGYSAGWQQQQLQAQGMPLQTPGRGPPMRFGSDSHFQPSGYSGPPLDIPETELQNLEWLESGPNTQPNTQPSSPSWSKKRKLDDYQRDHRNGFMLPNGHPASARRPPASHIKMDSRASVSLPHPAIAISKPHTALIDSFTREQYDHDEDAEAEDDDDPTASNTAALPSREPSPPAPWPSNKARPPKSNKPPPTPKPSRKRKKSESTASGTPSRKTSSKLTRQPSTRVPLTQAQKKANHTNSEQRRRDATARAYAELYDLVPEVAEMGKQSTMKKLEVVVEKVAKTIRVNQELRAKLGVQAGGSVAEMMEAQGLDASALVAMMDGQDEDNEEDEDGDGDEGDEEGANWDG
jgi:hypothetical protein